MPEAIEEPEYVKVTVNLTKGNYERLWTAAAFQGDTMTDTINRAINIYDQIHMLPAPEESGAIFKRAKCASIAWEDGDGRIRRIVRVE